MNNSQVAHLWANQSKESGKGSNMFFNGRKLYSYGHHFCLANIIRDTSPFDKQIVLFNSNKYSTSTAKHQAYTMRAINRDTQRVFHVPIVDFDEQFESDTKDAHEKNLNHYAKSIAVNLDHATRANKSSEWDLAQAYANKREALDYIQVFELGKKYKKAFENSVVVSDELTARIERQREKAKQLQEIQDAAFAKRIAEIEKDMPAWLNGEFSQGYLSLLPMVYLRVKGETLQTSRGASVNLKNAHRLFKLIQSGKDIRGFVIDGFTVIGINGVLTIGCHKIERSEINRFASSQGWGQIELH